MDILSGYTAHMKRAPLVILLTAIASASVAFVVYARSEQAAGGTSRLTIDQLIDIRHPSNPSWSPDGRRVAFLSERAGIANIFVAEPGASASGARALTTFPDGQGGGFFWSRDSQRIYFASQGDLWQVPASGGAPSAVWTTSSAELTLIPALASDLRSSRICNCGTLASR